MDARSEMFGTGQFKPPPAELLKTATPASVLNTGDLKEAEIPTELQQKPELHVPTDFALRIWEEFKKNPNFQILEQPGMFESTSLNFEAALKKPDFFAHLRAILQALNPKLSPDVRKGNFVAGFNGIMTNLGLRISPETPPPPVTPPTPPKPPGT